MNILLTGATGFVGSSLTPYLLDKGYSLTVAVRSLNDSIPICAKQLVVGEITSKTDWAEVLAGIDVVIHLAARVHDMKAMAGEFPDTFRDVNVASTLNFASQASCARVKRFIFLSSIKANGEYTEVGSPFLANDDNVPTDSYGLSKYEAEQGLYSISRKVGMDIVVLRPPLVYGPGVKGNFLSMIRWVYRGVPLPLGATNNKRSLVSIYNLIDLIEVCISHPKAANETFLVSDGEDLSTTELLLRLGAALGNSARLISLPPKWLSVVLNLIGRGSIAKRLTGSLQVDIEKTKSFLDWYPKVSVDKALDKTVAVWLSQNK